MFDSLNPLVVEFMASSNPLFIVQASVKSSISIDEIRNRFLRFQFVA
jgi:hypothetical protein